MQPVAWGVKGSYADIDFSGHEKKALRHWNTELLGMCRYQVVFWTAHMDRTGSEN